MLVKIGQGKEYRTSMIVDTIEDAVEFYNDERDASGEGASTFPEGLIFGQARGKVADAPFKRISYNGRTWPVESV